MTAATIGVNLRASQATARHGLGDRHIDHDGNEWVYAVSGATITAGDVVGFDETFTAALLTKAIADAGHHIGVARFPMGSGTFGWVQVRGVFPSVNVASTTAADKALYTTATAGRLSTTSSTQTRVEALVLTAAESAGNRAPGLSGVTLHAIPINA